MAEDQKKTVETYVTTALRSRVEEGARAVAALRDDLTAAAERLATALRSVGDSPLTLPEELFPPPPPPPPPAPAAETGVLSHILDSQRDLLAATDQVGLLTQLLLSCTVSCPRVAFFIVKKEALAGWAARGFPDAQDADVRSLSVGVGEKTIVGAAFRSGVPVRAEGGRYPQDEIFLSRLGGDPPQESMAVPIWIRDKIAAVIYGDAGQDDVITAPEIPEILATHAGLCLETLVTRQKYPRARTAEGAAAPPPAASPASVSGPITGSTPPVGAPAHKSSSALGSGTTAEPASLSGVFSRPSFTAPAETAPPPAAVAPAPPPPPSPRISAATPSIESLPEEDRKMHEEARRFARLLVSEIILYNERLVEDGRRNKDIYEKLKEDIDRSRSMYEQRISAKVRSQSNYFYQELVRTLANGDESAIKVPWA
jgi:hypothetical protein